MNDGNYDTICWKRCFYLLVCYKLSCNNNKYNEYNYNPAAIKFQCIFAWLLFTVHLNKPIKNF